MRFAPGEPLVRRSWRGGRVTFMFVTRVAADDEQGLRLWLPEGSPFWRVMTTDGQTHHDAPVDRLPGARLQRLVWTGTDAMIWMPENRAYSIFWFWSDGAFAGWYVNLEEPYVRWADRGCAGVDTADQALDLRVTPDRRWEWKDVDEFRERIGHPLYWTEAQAATIRATGEHVVRLIEAGEFPFDGTWCGFRPDAAWTLPALPAGADRPRATRSGAG